MDTSQDLLGQDWPRWATADTGASPRSRKPLTQAYSAVMTKTRTGMFIAAVISTSLVVAAPAHADNASDFLAIMSEQGIDVGSAPADVEITLSAAEYVCNLLHYGFTPQQAGEQLPYSLPNLTPQQAASFVDAAQAKLCEQAYAPLQPGGSY